MTLLACEISEILWQFGHSLALPFFGTGMKTDFFQSCGYCWVLRQLFHSLLSLLSRKLFSSFLLSAIRVVSSAYLRLLIFLPAILIPACASSSLALHMVYSECKLNNQGDNRQLSRTPFQIWKGVHCSMSGSNFVSWPAYRFLRRQVR